MSFTLTNLEEDVADVGSNFDGAPDLEFRLATKALGLEHSRPGCGAATRPATAEPIGDVAARHPGPA